MAVLWPCCGCVALCVVILLWLCCGCFWLLGGKGLKFCRCVEGCEVVVLCWSYVQIVVLVL